MKKKSIKLGNSKFKVIDLTEPLKENVEVFPGDPRPRKHVYFNYKKDGCQYNVYSIGDHHFHPHGDAPCHQDPRSKEKGFECWGMDYAFNKACLIDLSGSKMAIKREGIRYLPKITAKDILWHSAEIKKCSALLIRTGYDRWLEANKKHDPRHIPYIEKDAARLLGKYRSLKVIGVDSLTVDKVGDNYVHLQLRDILIVECLVNLHGIPQKHRKPFLLQTSPISIVGATGGPVLAYAFIKATKVGK